MKQVVLKVANSNSKASENTFDVDGIRKAVNGKDVVLIFNQVTSEAQENALFWYAVCNKITFERYDKDIFFVVPVSQIESITNID